MRALSSVGKDRCWISGSRLVLMEEKLLALILLAAVASDSRIDFYFRLFINFVSFSFSRYGFLAESISLFQVFQSYSGVFYFVKEWSKQAIYGVIQCFFNFTMKIKGVCLCV
ncbi:hypothetical protein DM860_005708 [Cuscuta australis]|uniref:Uncharacterized protein n=1 Tax=Cuscuta australis TaxID=267555 RepID=A0A328DRM5_9ASTE|nr:hypothetical protein DM860_005708 [Cuscuta australis]